MNEVAEQAVLDFYMYPSIGPDDWQYTFAAAQVRVLGTLMLSRATLLDIVNAEDFEQAVELLAGGEYALSVGERSSADLERLLKERRTEARKIFTALMIDEPTVELIRSRDDFANMRLALRRTLTGKPLGTDYSDDGNVEVEIFEQVFEEENYNLLPYHMQEAIERAVLGYYQNKEIRQIDYAIDAYQAEHNIKKAQELKSAFLLELFRMQIDLTNIRTMLRLKFTESEHRNVFLEGGYVEQQRLKHAMDIGHEAIAPLFFATPYYEVLERGVSYFVANNSFLKLEQHCEEHLIGFLRTTSQITAGPQPVIAYLLMKENEIRTVRFLLTAKRNQLDTRLILDRLGE